MGWDDGPRIEDERPRRSRGGVVPPVFRVAFILFDLVILAAVLFFLIAR